MSAITSGNHEVFGQVLAEFERSLTPKEKSFFVRTSIRDVHEEIEKLQKEQDTRRTLRNIRGMEPYIKGLLQFSEVIGIFVQGKPEVLAFIWVTFSAK
jgi:5-formaminoimidazole-4-carboxamide-1-beta-D-ribofuranosyl 5'-monophosphate synthetase